MRHAISFESCGNDGLSFLFVFLPFPVLTRPPEEALLYWVRQTLLWDVGVATLVGLAIGLTAGKPLETAESHDLMKEDWRLAYTVAVGLFMVGMGKLIQSDEVLVVFASATAFDQVVGSGVRSTEKTAHEAVNRFFAVPVFALLGIALPWSGRFAVGWSGVLLAVAVLIFRRISVLLLLRPLLPSARSIPDAPFLGWFGPVAVAAVYYSNLMEHRLENKLIWDVVSLMICSSLVAHGVSATPFTRLSVWESGGNESRNGLIPAKRITSKEHERAFLIICPTISRETASLPHQDLPASPKYPMFYMSSSLLAVGPFRLPLPQVRYSRLPTGHASSTAPPNAGDLNGKCLQLC